MSALLRGRVYVPVFLAVGTGALVAYCVVFLALVAVLVLAAKFVATRKPIAEVLERGEHILFPLVLIVLGLVILIEGGRIRPLTTRSACWPGADWSCPTSWFP